MQLSCKCLNIFINSNSQSFGLFDSKLKENVNNDSFFSEDVAPLLWSSVTIQIENLIEHKDVGDWTVSRCRNCNLKCYAIKKYVGFSSLIANKLLLCGANEINVLKRSEFYSPIFKILIFNQEAVSAHEVDINQELYPVATSWLKEQKVLAEERIKLYIEKEHASLDDMKFRALKEQQALLRKEMETDFKNNQNVNDTFVENIRGKGSLTKFHGELGDPSLDPEGIFFLEGYDATVPQDSNIDIEDNEQDFEEQPCRRTVLPNIAKSLPIPVPQFMEDRKSDRINGSPEVPSDIAASIKALAKSVHGDSVFGELPRPRFSAYL